MLVTLGGLDFLIIQHMKYLFLKTNFSWYELILELVSYVGYII